MKVVSYRDLDASAWDKVAEHSSAAWLFHRWEWVAIEARFAAKANCSFALADDRQHVIGIQPLYRRDQDRGWCERVLDSGYHRHTGLALRDDLTVETRQAAWKQAMRHVFAEAEHHDVDRVLLNAQNLAPANLAARTAEIPPWVREYGFELGLHMTPVGDRAVPGMSNVYADQVVSLDSSVDELFRGLDSACQRAVRKAEKAGLTFEEAQNDPVPAYYELATISAQRTGETLLPLTYYQDIWNALHKEGRAAVLFARHAERRVAALFLVVDKRAASFLAGVSHHDFLALRVNDYLHWHALVWARERGLSHYRFGPVFPEAPDDWPVAQVSRFKGKFGGQSLTTIQGNYFRKPERYRDDALRAAQEACALRIQEVQTRRQSEAARNADPARDLVVILRRYGYLGIDPRARPEDLVTEHGLWWPGCTVPLADCLDRLQAIFHAEGDALAAHGVQCHPEPGRSMIYAHKRWWQRRERVYRALLPHSSFSGPAVEPIWQNARGRAVLAWWHRSGRKILLVGLAAANELVRYTQGDPEQTRDATNRARFNFSFERANYLFDTNLVPGALSVPWADRLGFTLARLLAWQSGLPLAEPLPQGAKGLVLLTGDDDQAALAAYQEQLALLGEFPITYFLLPFTKHTSGTLAELPASVEFGLHVDALEQPDQYETICAEQAAAVRALCSQPVRAIRNHGFLNRGYLGHLRAWEECGLALDINYAGLDGTALTGSFLPFRVRRPDGFWSGHFGLLTAFGDGMRYIGKLTEDQAVARIDRLAAQIEKSDPGVLVFNMHPENIADTRRIHRRIIELGRRPGWLAMGVESYLQWLEKWQSLTIRADGPKVLLHAPSGVADVVLSQPLAGEWRRLASATSSEVQVVTPLKQAG
jgi:hypothetical protein